MDRRHLSLARETDVRYELLIPGETEAMLLVEYHAENRRRLACKAGYAGRAGAVSQRLGGRVVRCRR